MVNKIFRRVKNFLLLRKKNIVGEAEWVKEVSAVCANPRFNGYPAEKLRNIAMHQAVIKRALDLTKISDPKLRSAVLDASTREHLRTLQKLDFGRPVGVIDDHANATNKDLNQLLGGKMKAFARNAQIVTKQSRKYFLEAARLEEESRP